MQKTQSKVATQSEWKQIKKVEKKTTISNDELALAYRELKEEEERLSVQKDALKELIKERLVKGELSTVYGTFYLEHPKSLKWDIENLKDIFGTSWISWVLPDHATLRERSREVDTIGCLLQSTARVTESERLTFRD